MSSEVKPAKHFNKKRLERIGFIAFVLIVSLLVNSELGKRAKDHGFNLNTGKIVATSPSNADAIVNANANEHNLPSQEECAQIVKELTSMTPPTNPSTTSTSGTFLMMITQLKFQVRWF